MKKKWVLALIIVGLLILENLGVGLFFLLFYPIRIGVPLFVVLTISSFLGGLVFIFIVNIIATYYKK